jgi:hypothetical protein
MATFESRGKSQLYSMPYHRARHLPAKLAAHYANAALGKINVSHEGNRTLFDFGGWHSEVASRKNDDGTLSFITIDPGEGGSEFVVADNGSEKTLLVRDAQHEYRYEASKSQDGVRAP